MSTRATQWVIEEAPVPGHLFAVLACLGWKADEDGRGAHPSIPTLATWTGKTPRQVRADLRALEDEDVALISPGDQSLAEYIRADRRPVVWDLAMPRTTGSTRQVVSFRAEVRDLSSGSARKLTTTRPPSNDRKPASANMSLKENPSPSRKREAYDDPAFAEFWDAYPRKVGKREAWKAWAAETARGADPVRIVKAAIRYAEGRAGQPEKFTAHAATWLRQARYDDEPAGGPPAERDDASWMG